MDLLYGLLTSQLKFQSTFKETWLLSVFFVVDLLFSTVDGIIKLPHGPYGPTWAHKGPYGPNIKVFNQNIKVFG